MFYFALDIENFMIDMINIRQTLMNGKQLSFVFLGLHPRHVEVPRRGVKSELQLLAYTAATETLALSHI